MDKPRKQGQSRSLSRLIAHAAACLIISLGLASVAMAGEAPDDDRGGVAGEIAQKAFGDVPDNWDTRPAQFVDPNAPFIGEERLHFPIADPRACSGSPAGSAEGFSYTDPISGVRLPGGEPDNQRLPMPVRWLYVLEDGTCGHLDADNRFVGENPASETNPIVARYAYWADDEGCNLYRSPSLVRGAPPAGGTRALPAHGRERGVRTQP